MLSVSEKKISYHINRNNEKESNGSFRNENTIFEIKNSLHGFNS